MKANCTTTEQQAIDTVQSIYAQTHFYAAGMKTVEVRQEMKACIEALTQFVQMDIDMSEFTDIECKLELAALSATHDTSAEPVKLIRTLTPLIMSTDSASMANLIAPVEAIPQQRNTRSS